MDAITHTAARSRLAKLLEQVNESGSPVLITRQRGKAAVLMSLDEYTALDETAHLMRSPKNAARVKSALRELDVGKGVRHTLHK